jgi:GTP cyclohydrolase I
MRKIEEGIKTIIEEMGFESKDPNFVDTPKRVARFYKELISCEKPSLTTFPTRSREMLLIKGHVAWSLCPHHLLPVKYEVKVGYICAGKALGLSKLARIVDYHMAKLPLQEDLSLLIMDDLKEALNPPGYGVVVKGDHLCMQMRGVKSPCANAITNGLRGQFLFNPATREEFLRA